MDSSGDSPSSRSAAMAKSTIMMPFFFTMPIKRIRPMRLMSVKSMWNRYIINSAPSPADGKVERIVIGCT